MYNSIKNNKTQIYLNIQVKYLYTENSKTMKEIKEDTKQVELYLMFTEEKNQCY